MKTKPLAWTLGLGILFLATFYLLVRGPSGAPAGQQPLLALSSANFGEFEKAFDANADVPRLLLLVSPT